MCKAGPATLGYLGLAEREDVGASCVAGRLDRLGLEGISIEFPGIILGGLGYYIGLMSQDRVG